MFVIAATAFALGLVVAFSTVELPSSGIEWRFLALSLILGVPATVATNALEVLFAGRQVGRRIAYSSGVNVAVLGTAANLLPVPGAMLVRTGDLIGRGSSPRVATRAQFAVGLLWTGVSVAGIAVAAGLFELQWQWLWWLGALGFAVCGIRLLPNRSFATGLSILAIEAVSVAITALRLLAVWKAMGVESTFMVALPVAGANALAALAWVIPSGLALREFISSLLASMFGLAPAAGFSAQGIDRIIGLVGHLALAAVVRWRSGRTS